MTRFNPPTQTAYKSYVCGQAGNEGNESHTCPPPVFRRFRGVVMRPQFQCGSRRPWRNLCERDELSPAHTVTERWRILANQTDGVVPLGRSDSAFGIRTTAVHFSHGVRRRGSRSASKKKRALLIRARRPAAAPLHGPVPVAREFALTAFVPVAANANRRAPAERSIAR
jgi:hypothetical protein